MTNFELYQNMVEKTNLNKIFNIAAEEVFAVIPDDVMSKGMKDTIRKATEIITPVVTGIYKNAFLRVYENEFTNEELGQLLAYYGPGSVLWSFFNTGDFFPWLRATIREVIQEKINGLDLASMSTEELQGLAQIGLSDILGKLPEWVKIGSTDYLISNLCRREATLGDKVTIEANKEMVKIDWYNLLEKSGITLPD